MAVAVVATAGSASANSYVTLAAANTYFEARLNVGAWDAADDDTKNRALVQATRHLDEQLDWVGSRTSTAQALQWPRSGIVTRDGDADVSDATIPQFIADATCEQALAELNTDRAADAASRGVRSASVGPLSVTFDGVASSTQNVLADIVVAMLDPWIDVSMSGSSMSAHELARV